jgi:hypothetical protein
MAGRGRGGLLQVGRRHREHEPAAQLAYLLNDAGHSPVGAKRGPRFPWPAGPGPLQAVTVTVAASTKYSALMAKVHHLGPEEQST